MTEQEFRDKLEKAEGTAKNLPEWKRNILVNSSKASSPIARPPVHNSSLAGSAGVSGS